LLYAKKVPTIFKAFLWEETTDLQFKVKLALPVEKQVKSFWLKLPFDYGSKSTRKVILEKKYLYIFCGVVSIISNF
jgi:hypothetical protein